MAKTLIDFVQQILSDADGDDVNSITDTVESDQCARIVRDSFDQIVDIYDLDHTKATKQLEATTSATPVVMTRPEGFYNIEYIKYDKRVAAGDPQRYQTVTFMEPKRFLEYTGNRTSSDTTVDEVTLSSGHVLLARNDAPPTYWTILDGYSSLVFDAYDSGLESNLQASKSLAYGIQKPSLTLADASVPNLPTHLETLLLREARSVYFDLYKDGITSEIDRTRRRAEVRSQRMRRIAKNQDNNNSPNFGRK